MSVDETQGLVGTWIRVPEDDSDGVAVYRPAGYPLPPARGRTSFTLRADGSAAAGSPGPDDRGTSTPGSWSLEGSLLTVTTGIGRDCFDLITFDDTALRVRPQSDGPAAAGLPTPASTAPASTAPATGDS